MNKIIKLTNSLYVKLHNKDLHSLNLKQSIWAKEFKLTSKVLSVVVDGMPQMLSINLLIFYSQHCLNLVDNFLHGITANNLVVWELL